MAIKAIYTIVSDPDVAVVILRKFHNKLRKTVYKEVIRAINRLNLDKNDFKITASPMQITYLPYGNTIYFTGSDSIDDTKGMIDGLKPIKLVEIDELTEFFDKGEGEDDLLNIEATFVRGMKSNSAWNITLTHQRIKNLLLCNGLIKWLPGKIAYGLVQLILMFLSIG